MRVFKYLKHSLPSVLAVVVLLVIQAYCDLSLPAYTSKIIDVGIGQGGVESAMPDQIRPETLDLLELFLPDEKAGELHHAFSLYPDGLYRPSTYADEGYLDAAGKLIGEAVLTMASLQPSADSVSVSEAASEQTSAMPDLNSPEIAGKLAQIKGAIESGMMTKEQFLASLSQGREAGALAAMSDDMREMATEKAAIAFIRMEYTAQDIDMQKYQTDYMWGIGFIMLALTFASMASAILVCFIASRAAAGVGRGLRSRLYSHVLSFSKAEIDKFSTASLITRNTNDIQLIQMTTVMVLRMLLYAPIIGVGGLLKVINTRTGLEWIVAVAVVYVLGVVLILLSATMPKFKKAQKLIDRLNLVSREILTGLPVIRAFSREDYEEERFGQASENLKKNQLFTTRAMSLMMPLMMISMNGIALLITWFSAKGMDTGAMQVGDMVAFITYTIQIVMAFMMISMFATFLPRAAVASERIDEVLDTPSTILDPSQPIALGPDVTGRVSFRDVSFKFPGADENVLEHISFEAEPGETTAIIGSTGSGKSTLVSLIPRLYDVTGGAITIDGIDIRDLSLHDLHALIGFVPQKGVLFSGDIASNIKFGDEDHISDEDMARAAEIAQAVGFIEEKDEGYGSHIAQGGDNVSGGQKQRLSIARAIAKNPKIFIFDDSFSALDFKTDVALRRALGRSIGAAAVLIVAQRISTILHADRIIVLDDGRIAGMGTHSELLQTCEAYREIAVSQLSPEELGIEEVAAHE